MVLKLYNTLTRQIEIFKPLENNRVRMYSCGPTVYNYAHIGNWRSILMADFLKRVLTYNGFNVDSVMNITDVDDKTIRGSQAADEPLAEFTKFYEDAFLTDLASLNIQLPTKLTHATLYIPQMVNLINKLIDTGHAYKTSDGIYFSVSTFPDYGKLSKRPIEQSEGYDDETHDKKDPRDFALWKFQTPADGSVGWDAPFGKGRPGWHIECSAMSMCELGEQFDIHTGGTDLMFPHHENEIAQSEAATGKSPFSRFWLHGAFLNVESEKMSKSLSNFYTLRDVKEKKISPLAYRYWTMTAHYRTPANFTWEALEGAQTALNRIYNTVREFGFRSGKVNSDYQNKFLTAINDDLNLPQAVAIIWELVADASVSNADKYATLSNFDQVLGLGLDLVKPLEIPQQVSDLVTQREEARKTQNWALADQLRDQINSLGYQVNDTPSGPQITLDF